MISSSENKDSGQRVALLIDGENISSSFAGQIIVQAGLRENLLVKRVYGNATLIKGWESAPGIRLVHSGTGKNSADILLAIEAVDLAHRGKINSFVIASSDGDFSHLAHYLRENGFSVLGIGEAKAPNAFVKACSRFAWIESSDVSAPKPLANSNEKLASDKTINGYVTRLIDETTDGQGMRIGLLGSKMQQPP